jgi:DNA (cytosine-5)-methyltransferase 1
MAVDAHPTGYVRLCGDARVFSPGGHIANDGRDNTKMIGRSENTITLDVWQALVLQSFRPDYPVQGTRSSQFMQVGNAVPPVLAAAILRQLV